MSNIKIIAVKNSIFGITRSGFRIRNIHGDVYELEYFNPFFLTGSWPWVRTGRFINENTFFRLLRVRDVKSKPPRYNRERNPSGRIGAHLKNENFTPSKPIKTTSGLKMKSSYLTYYAAYDEFGREVSHGNGATTVEHDGFIDPEKFRVSHKAALLELAKENNENASSVVIKSLMKL